ncbi:MAG: asparagine synthase (glutamine-hydrolyzing) [Candidatus Obscuribacterales bacterium]|nr:asparagine synthase (glutamine-hydrolyzing) [Candidatus Obscuribacterales bacterium]
MCGIAGFLGKWNDEVLTEMMSSLSHRGPDGNGKFLDKSTAGDLVGLAHTRLSILDLSSAAAQPMLSPCGQYVVTFNGEIYNFRHLRQSLEAAGELFASSGDTEVLLRLYMRHGEEMLSLLDGIFAFCIYNKADGSLFAARDHLGVKPFYYAELPGGFLFASELKALVCCPDVPRAIDEQSVLNHVGFIWSAGTGTMLKAIKKLRPGHWLKVFGGGRTQVGRYYRTPLPRHTSNHTAAELLELLDKVVQDQMTSDVPVGALLSGGVDSSAIVASMCRIREPASIKTFCSVVARAGVTDNFGDDPRYANLVAQRLGVGIVDVPSSANLAEEFGPMLWALDEPTADFSALQTFQLAAAARANGITVLMSGVGGDDLFTGYGRHTAILAHTMVPPPLRGIIGSLASQVPPANVLGRRLRRLGDLFKLDAEQLLCESMSFSATRAPERLALLKGSSSLFADQPAMQECLLQSKGYDPVTRVLDLELNGFLPDQNLNYADKMGMRAGVEIRVPLIDRRLVEFAMHLPTSCKIDIRQTKKILRQSQSDRLPASVLTRPKQGFGLPLRHWLAHEGRELLLDLTDATTVQNRGLFDPSCVLSLRSEFQSGTGDVAATLLSIMAVESWCRELSARPVRAVNRSGN